MIEIKRDKIRRTQNFVKHSGIAVMAFLILFLSTASAITIDEIQIPGVAACNPDIYNDKVVWQETRFYNGEVGDYDYIYMYDISTSQKTRITRDILEPHQYDPAIYEDKMVCKDFRNGSYNIYMYDISTFQGTQISHSGQANSPDIYGDKIVWSDQRNDDVHPDIYMFDLSTSQETQISHSGKVANPVIYGDKIVWEDRRNGENNADIYIYDLSTSQETQISHSGQANSPDIYGDKIVWEDRRNGRSDIYLYNLSTSQETQIFNSESVGAPAIYGDKIVWVTRYGTAVDICSFYIYNLSTSQHTMINVNDLLENPVIYGDRIVWQNGPDYDSNRILIYTASEEEMEPILPTANFNTNVTDGYAPLTVQFNGSSKNATALNWDFENDGKIDSTEANPVYIFSAPRVYTVNLTATNQNGTDSKLATITVLERTLPPAANFITNVTGGFAPLSVQFADISVNATSWRWTFGDGTNSTSKNPIHRYSRAGNYTVSLTATNAAGSNTMTKTNYIKVTAIVRPVASFTSNVTSGYTPLTVAFTDKSTNTPTSWKWTFGDGTNSTVKNPVHKYSTAGNYTVALTASNSAGSNTTTRTNYIKISAVTKPFANFTSNVTSGYTPLTVLFTDKSTNNPTAWKWTFGDGTNSTSKNPTHKYSTKGNYTVSLTATNAAGSSTTTKTNYIRVATVVKPVTNFTSNVTSGTAPLTVAFTDKSTNNPTAWKWTFGDGTNSTSKNPIHRYSVKGNYTVGLTATNAAGSSTITKTNYIKVLAVVKPVANFTSNVTSGYAPLTVAFIDKSTNTPTSWKWTFGDGTNSTVKNPVHKYSTAGNYTIAITASNSAGSNTTTKANYIKIINR